MANLQDQIKQAKDAGYSDEEVAQYLSAKPEYSDKFKTAISAGYKPEEIISHLSGGQAVTQPVERKSTLPTSLESPDKYQNIGNAVAGLVRGAGSIGATLLSPIDAAVRALNDGKPFNVGGYDIAGHDRRKGMDEGLTAMGADPKSLEFQGGKLAGEIAGTAGVGGVLAKGLRAVAPGMPAFANALATSGMRAGTTPGAANMLTRMAGGAVTGGATAGLIDPSYAGTGAAIGGALPPAMAGMAKAGSMIKNTLSGQPVASGTQSAIKEARKLGYVIPPTQAKSSLGNRLIEGFSGKLTTAQNASARNAEITNKLAAKAIGLPKGQQITPEVLSAIRETAGDAYRQIGNAGTITPGKAYADALDDIAAPYIKAASGFPNAKQSPVIDLVESLKSPTFDTASAIEKIKQLRSAADDAFRTGNTDIARASKGAAKALEDAIDQHLQKIGDKQLLDNFRDSRQLIAKTYTVEKALNQTTGTIDARKLAAQLEKGKPLTAELRQAAEFAQRFKKAAATPESMGSLPQNSPLDYAALGALSGSIGNPLPMLGLVARPAARKLALSDLVQNRLARESGQSALARLMSNPEAEQLLYRTAPAIGAR